MTDIQVNVDVEKTVNKKLRCKHNNYFLSIVVAEHLDNTEKAKVLANKLNVIIKQKVKEIVSYLSVNDTVNKDAKLDGRWIKNIDVQTDIQLDQRFYRPVSYVMVAITHYTSIKLDIKKLKSDIFEELGHKINMSHKLYKDAKPNFNNYMLKNTI